MTNLCLWGTGFENMAEGIDPHRFHELFLRHGSDGEPSPSFSPASLIAEGPQSRCWVSPPAEGPSVFVAGPCASSMQLAWALHQKNLLSEWDSLLVSSQWAGRGQLGRAWVSPAGNIYGTVRLPDSSLFQAGCLPLLLGHALVIALDLLGIHVTLKWPNDLILNSKKVGGVLIEERAGVKMAGVGINLASCPSDETRRTPNALSAACLRDADAGDLNPLRLWRHLIDAMRDVFKNKEISDLPDFLARIPSRLAFAGDDVGVEEYAKGSYEARILGLSSDGGLILRTASGTRIVHSASIYPLAVGKKIKETSPPAAGG